jgi:dTDP-4-dehydrorhamnose reductase
MVKMNVIGTGLNGLLGSRMLELLGDGFTFQNISRATGVDITNKEQVSAAIASSDAQVVLHLTAKTDVDGCEQDKELGEDGQAWKMNVAGTQFVVDACKSAGKKIIYFSTDFVFDGERGSYTEEDQPSPVNWYGRTKYGAESIVRSAGIPYLILRPAYPFGRPFEKKKDFVQAILGRLQEGQPVMGITDHIFTPTYLDDIAYAVAALLHADATGIFHVAGSQSLTPYDAAVAIAKTFGYDEALVRKTTRNEFFVNRAFRPYNLSLNNDKIRGLGVKMRRFIDGLEEVKKTTHTKPVAL